MPTTFLAIWLPFAQPSGSGAFGPPHGPPRTARPSRPCRAERGQLTAASAVAIADPVCLGRMTGLRVAETGNRAAGRAAGPAPATTAARSGYPRCMRAPDMQNDTKGSSHPGIRILSVTRTPQASQQPCTAPATPFQRGNRVPGPVSPPTGSPCVGAPDDLLPGRQDRVVRALPCEGCKGPQRQTTHSGPHVCPPAGQSREGRRCVGAGRTGPAGPLVARALGRGRTRRRFR